MSKRGLIFCVLLFIATTAQAQSGGEKNNPYERMALIPAGEYMMGDLKSKAELNPWDALAIDRHMLGPEDPAHEIYVDAFYIDIYEATNADYEEYVKATGATKPEFWDDKNFNDPRQPVVGVSWKEASSFCAWKNKRLPTEAEWEKAGRGKRAVKYPWGDDPPAGGKLNYNEETGKPLPVGSFEAGKSDYGLYDMSGNVSEWVFDWHSPIFYLFSPQKNPKGANTGQYKVTRGGNWRNPKNDVTLTYRGASAPYIRTQAIGFRCAAEAKE